VEGVEVEGDGVVKVGVGERGVAVLRGGGARQGVARRGDLAVLPAFELVAAGEGAGEGGLEEIFGEPGGARPEPRADHVVVRADGDRAGPGGEEVAGEVVAGGDVAQVAAFGMARAALAAVLVPVAPRIDARDGAAAQGPVDPGCVVEPIEAEGGVGAEGAHRVARVLAGDEGAAELVADAAEAVADAIPIVDERSPVEDGLLRVGGVACGVPGDGAVAHLGHPIPALVAGGDGVARLRGAARDEADHLGFLGGVVLDQVGARTAEEKARVGAGGRVGRAGGGAREDQGCDDRVARMVHSMLLRAGVSPPALRGRCGDIAALQHFERVRHWWPHRIGSPGIGRARGFA
jgi:hypothetical protein